MLHPEVTLSSWQDVKNPKTNQKMVTWQTLKTELWSYDVSSYHSLKEQIKNWGRDEHLVWIVKLWCKFIPFTEGTNQGLTARAHFFCFYFQEKYVGLAVQPLNGTNCMCHKSQNLMLGLCRFLLISKLFEIMYSSLQLCTSLIFLLPCPPPPSWSCKVLKAFKDRFLKVTIIIVIIIIIILLRSKHTNGYRSTFEKINNVKQWAKFSTVCLFQANKHINNTVTMMKREIKRLWKKKWSSLYVCLLEKGELMKIGTLFCIIWCWFFLRHCSWPFYVCFSFLNLISDCWQSTLFQIVYWDF